MNLDNNNKLKQAPSYSLCNFYLSENSGKSKLMRSSYVQMSSTIKRDGRYFIVFCVINPSSTLIPRISGLQPIAWNPQLGTRWLRPNSHRLFQYDFGKIKE